MASALASTTTLSPLPALGATPALGPKIVNDSHERDKEKAKEKEKEKDKIKDKAALSWADSDVSPEAASPNEIGNGNDKPEDKKLNGVRLLCPRWANGIHCEFRMPWQKSVPGKNCPFYHPALLNKDGNRICRKSLSLRKSVSGGCVVTQTGHHDEYAHVTQAEFLLALTNWKQQHNYDALHGDLVQKWNASHPTPYRDTPNATGSDASSASSSSIFSNRIRQKPRPEAVGHKKGKRDTLHWLGVGKGGSTQLTAKNADEKEKEREREKESVSNTNASVTPEQLTTLMAQLNQLQITNQMQYAHLMTALLANSVRTTAPGPAGVMSSYSPPMHPMGMFGFAQPYGHSQQFSQGAQPFGLAEAQNYNGNTNVSAANGTSASTS
jgi:hypothetical protein